MTKTFSDMRDEVRTWTVEKGWRGESAPKRTFGDDMSLLHSEVSEAIEAYRKYGTDRMASSVETDWKPLDGTLGPNTNFGYPVTPQGSPAKPQGVPSELADVLIRLLDNYAEWDCQPTEGSPAWVDDLRYPTFGSAMDALHNQISSASMAYSAYSDMTDNFLREVVADNFDNILIELLVIALFYQIDLLAEYEAKMAYNNTRSHRHGGKLL